MVELDGRSYIVNTPTENALSLLEFVNKFMVDNEVKDKNGNIVQFKISLASPIWLIIIGVGFMATVCQKIMYAVAQAFNIADCSEQQVLNLAEIARLQRKEGSYTTVSCTATASAAGTCHITTDLEAKVEYEGKEYTFHPIYETTIPAETSAEVILICTETGPVYFEIGVITEFETEVANLDSFSSGAPQPGSGLESISSLRTRLMTNESISPLAGAIQGLNALDGITKAQLFYNNDYTADSLIAGITVPPKKAILFIQGYSDKIAEEYCKHMSAQTVDAIVDASGNSIQPQTQGYTLLNGQLFNVHYYNPVPVNLMIKVKVSEALTIERQQEIANAIKNLSNSRGIGVNYTTAYIIDSINANLSFTEITTVELSTDGNNWFNTTSFNEANIGLISGNNVSFEWPTEE